LIYRVQKKLSFFLFINYRIKILYQKEMRRALLIGINYIGTSDKLLGCINDVIIMKEVLKDKFNIEDKNILTLTDNTTYKPNKENILNAFDWLLSEENSKAFDGKKKYKISDNPLLLFFQYSGHGSSTRDKNDDEEDGSDETLVPLDYKKKGMIVDDVIRSSFINKINSKSYLYSLLDCCQSGTNMDLKYVISYKNDSTDLNVNKKVESTNSHIILFSGCKDSQSSLDSNQDGNPCGLATYCFLKCLKENNYKISINNLYDKYYHLVTNEYKKQQPVLSYSFKDDNLQRNFMEME